MRIGPKLKVLRTAKHTEPSVMADRVSISEIAHIFCIKITQNQSSFINA